MDAHLRFAPQVGFRAFFPGRKAAPALPTASITQTVSLGAVAQRLEAARRVLCTQSQ